jgi:uncharacterized membrane protein YcaP (DUF421 family)
LRNLRREHITLQELREKLREQGVEDLAEVKAAYLEGDGQISVIRSSPQVRQKHPQGMPGR